MKMAEIKSSIRGYGSPSRYYQGPGLLHDLWKYTGKFGKNAHAIITRCLFEKLTKELKKDFCKTDCSIETQIFDSEVSEERISIATEKAKKCKPDVIVAIGGGKTIDTAKAVASICAKPLIVAPSNASTDAPTTAVSVIYSEDGLHLYAKFHKKNPDIVLMDSQLIADAPVRFLVAGMGDALSTYFEARANELSDSSTYIDGVGFRRTRTGITIAESCYKELIKNGFKALKSAERHVVTEALEDVIEANTLMSGQGVENVGCSGAHSICEGISALPEDKKTYHGEKVGFGVLCQLVAENASTELLDEVYGFCCKVRLPVTLEDLYIESTSENIHKIAKLSMESYWGTEPFFIDVDGVTAAISLADELGKKYKELYESVPYCKQ